MLSLYFGDRLWGSLQNRRVSEMGYDHFKDLHGMILNGGLEYSELPVHELRMSIQVAARLEYIAEDVASQELTDVRMSILHDSEDVMQTLRCTIRGYTQYPIGESRALSGIS